MAIFWPIFRVIVLMVCLFSGVKSVSATEIKAKLCKKTESYERQYGDLSVLEANSYFKMKLKSWDKYYLVKAPVEEVFKAYVAGHPGKLWPSDLVKYRFAYAKGSNQKILKEDPWPGTHIGMKVFVDIVLKPGNFCKTMTAIVVNQMVPNEKIVYEYLEGSITTGFNEMSFDKTYDSLGNEMTLIHHYSRYQGVSRFFKMIFPFGYSKNHGAFMDGVHQNMKELIEGGLL